jgi:hypothetical protein
MLILGTRTRKYYCDNVVEGQINELKEQVQTRYQRRRNMFFWYLNPGCPSYKQLRTTIIGFLDISIVVLFSLLSFLCFGKWSVCQDSINWAHLPEDEDRMQSLKLFKIKHKLMDNVQKVNNCNSTLYHPIALCRCFTFTVYVQLWSMFIHILFIINHYMLQPNWPSSGIQVVVLKESAVLFLFFKGLRQ